MDGGGGMLSGIDVGGGERHRFSLAGLLMRRGAGRLGTFSSDGGGESGGALLSARKGVRNRAG